MFELRQVGTWIDANGKTQPHPPKLINPRGVVAITFGWSSPYSGDLVVEMAGGQMISGRYLSHDAAMEAAAQLAKLVDAAA